MKGCKLYLTQETTFSPENVAGRESSTSLSHLKSKIFLNFPARAPFDRAPRTQMYLDQGSCFNISSPEMAVILCLRSKSKYIEKFSKILRISNFDDEPTFKPCGCSHIGRGEKLKHVRTVKKMGRVRY